MVEFPFLVILGIVSATKALPVLCIPLSGVLHPEDLAKRAGNGGALESNLVVIHAIDITNQHVYSAIVSAIRHCQHVIKGSRASQ